MTIPESLTLKERYYEASPARFTLTETNVHFFHRLVTIIVKATSNLTGLNYALNYRSLVTRDDKRESITVVKLK
jgi:hypothetical protein